MLKKKKGQILYIMGRDDQITTNVKLLDIMHESHGFIGDLHNMNVNVVRLVSVGVITGFIAMCKDSR